MYIFLDKDGNAVDMNDDNAAIADVKLLNDDMMKSATPSFSREEIEALRKVIDKGIEIITTVATKTIEELADALQIAIQEVAESYEEELFDDEDDRNLVKDDDGDTTQQMVQINKYYLRRIPP